MKVVSCNLAELRTIQWRGKLVKTGIVKKSVSEGIMLGLTDVVGDQVIDRKYHGGEDQACYLYGVAQYNHWKELYPGLEWHYGFLGENITIEDLDESKMMVGSRYQLGTAEVEVTKPRQPCYKLGVIMGSQKFLRVFWQAPYPGVYLKVIKVGKVVVGDEMILLAEANSKLSILDVYRKKSKIKNI